MLEQCRLLDISVIRFKQKPRTEDGRSSRSIAKVLRKKSAQFSVIFFGASGGIFEIPIYPFVQTKHFRKMGKVTLNMACSCLHSGYGCLPVSISTVSAPVAQISALNVYFCSARTCFPRKSMSASRSDNQRTSGDIQKIVPCNEARCLRFPPLVVGARTSESTSMEFAQKVIKSTDCHLFALRYRNQ